MEAISTINVRELKPHPQNTEIYGEEDIEELVSKIRESGWIKPLVIKSDGTIISGHRRLKACLLLGIEEIQYEEIHFNNENEEMERLLLENQSREKTMYQKIQEGKFWEEVIKEKARLRKLSTLNNQTVDVVNSPQRENKVFGKTRDTVGEKIGVSGKTYEIAKKIVEEIDKSKDEGNKKNSEVLKIALNETVNGAKELLKTDLTKINEELKDKVINKEITAKEAIKEIKIELGKDKEIETADVVNSPQREKEKDQINEISIISDFEVDKNNFIESMKKYMKLEEQFGAMKQGEKNKISDYITDIKDMVDEVMNLLY